MQRGATVSCYLTGSLRIQFSALWKSCVLASQDTADLRLLQRFAPIRVGLSAATIPGDSRRFIVDRDGLFTDLKIKKLCRISPDRASTCTNAVEVLRRYLNRSEMIGPVVDVLRRIETSDQTDEPGVQCTGQGGGLAPIRSRLSNEARAELVAKRTSMTLKALAEEYGVSLSSVKRILNGTISAE